MSEVLQAGYKLTEVGVIPEAWEAEPIGRCLKIRHGKSQHEVVSASGEYPIFGTGGEMGRASRPLYSKPSVLIGRKGTIDAPRYLDTPFWTVDTLFYSEVFENVDAKFMFYQFCLVDWYAYNEASGVPSLNAKTIEKIQIPYPPSKLEQRAIAAALSDIDSLLAKLDTLIAKKRNIKQATMQQLLTGQTRLPGFSGEWEVKRLGDVAKITRGASPRPIDNPIWFDETSSVGWVRISDVTKSGMFLRETTQHLSLLGIKSSRPVNHGSLIMSICATVGRPVITELETCIHDGFVAFDKLLVNQTYLYYALKFIEDDWSKHGQTGSQMNLNTALINRTVISVPKSADEQTAIAAVLSDMDTELATLETRRDKTQALKQGMMQELLTGRIRLIDGVLND